MPTRTFAFSVFFTVVSVVTYAVALGMTMRWSPSIAALSRFPDLSEGLLAVIGISHAGYLVNKAVTNPTTSHD